MSSTGEHAPDAAATVADDRQDPAMKALFKMSRTAGVGLQDYAAVNVPSVVGLILGVASFLAVAWADSFAVLIIPAAAIVISAVALYQILRSNGTQTGQLLAIGGLVLGLAFASVNGLGHVRTASREAAWKGELNALVAKLTSAATTQGVESTYQLFDDRFRETVQFATFERTMKGRMNNWFYGKPITGAHVGDLVDFQTDNETGVVTATALLVFTGDGTMPDGRPAAVEYTAEFKRGTDGVWKIHSIPDWFGAAKKPQQPG